MPGQSLRRSERLAKRHPVNPNERIKNANRPNTPTLLGLPAELRDPIYLHVLVAPRPYLIGRCQEDLMKGPGSGDRSPRDRLCSLTQKLKRNDKQFRPVQPPITRVCPLLREETLPIFYAENEFWLVHPEFQPDWENPEMQIPLGFDPWLQQTPRDMFDHMRRVTLCGYANWPDRLMINLDLKTRKMTGWRHYSTYGHVMSAPVKEGTHAWGEGTKNFVEEQERVFASTEGMGGFEALQSVVDSSMKMFWMSDAPIGRPLGRYHRQNLPLMEGLEYDW